MEPACSCVLPCGFWANHVVATEAGPDLTAVQPLLREMERDGERWREMETGDRRQETGDRRQETGDKETRRQGDIFIEET
jgi:hypothetical protein